MKMISIILAIVVFAIIISLPSVHAEDELYIIYLKEPQTWYTPSGVGNTTSEIKVRTLRRATNVVVGYPIADIKYGKKIYIPYTNIKMIVEGSSYFSKRKLMEEDTL